MKDRFKNLIWMVAIIAIVSIYSLVSGGTSCYLEFGEDSITAHGPENYSYSVEYNKIAALESVNEFDAGTLVNGGETRKYLWGAWENDTWGEYTLCASKKIDNALVITCTDGSYLVVNYESEDTTRSLKELLSDMIEQQDTANNEN